MASAWFIKDVYFNNKLAQLQTAEPAYGWTTAKLNDAFTAAGYALDDDGLFRHFNEHGNSEELSPDALFKVDEYLAAKAAQLNALENGADGYQWNAALVLQAIKNAGMTVWEHYGLHGMYEDINPSNAFDNSSYLDAKLAQLLRDEPDAGWTRDSMLDAFRAAGLNPVEHYYLYGAQERIPATPVAAADRVTPDPDYNPYTPDQHPGVVFSLSTGDNNFLGTSNDDEISGVTTTSKSTTTLHAGDAIDGGAGNDVLKVDIKKDFDGFTGDGYLKNVQTVALTTDGAKTDLFFSAKGVEDVDTYNIHTSGKGNGVDLKELSEAGITVNEYGVKDDITIGFTTAAVKGSDDALTLGLSSVGADDAAVKVTAKGIENLTVTAAGDNFVNLSDVTEAKSISVSGDGALTVTGVANKVTSFDATAATGDITADLSGAALKTLSGGVGDDEFTVTTLGKGSVLAGGTGNDSLILSGAIGNKAASATISGFENITVDNATVTLIGDNITGLESLTLKGTTGPVKLTDTNVSSLTVIADDKNTVGNAAITGDLDTLYVEADDGGTLTIKANEATNVYITAGDDLTLNGSQFNSAETVTIVQEDGKLTFANFDFASLNELNVSGTDGEVALGALGSDEGSLEVTANGLEGGFTFGAIDVGSKYDVTLDLSGVVGSIKGGTVEGGEVNIDFSGYDGMVKTGNGTPAPGNAEIDVITGSTVELSGSKVADNEFGDATTAGIITSDLTYTGGVGEDQVSLKAAEGATNRTVTATFDTRAGDDIIFVTAETDTTSITLNGNLGSGNDQVTVTGIDKTNGAINIDIASLTGYENASITGSGRTGIAADTVADKFAAGTGADEFILWTATNAVAAATSSKSTAVINGFNIEQDTVDLGKGALSDQSGSEVKLTFVKTDAGKDNIEDFIALADKALGTASVAYYLGVNKGVVYLVSGAAGTSVEEKHDAVVELHGVNISSITQDAGTYDSGFAFIV